MKPAIGKIVCVKIAENEIRPAIIVKVFSDDCINAFMFPDCINDGAENLAYKSYTINGPDTSIGGFYAYGVILPSIMKGNGIGNWNWPGKI